MRDVLREQQFAFARHLREPSRHAPPPGIEARRLRVYRDLFFNAIESLLASGFPVIRETLGDARWKNLVHAFHATHRSRTPLFPQVGREFVDWLAAGHPAWLAELAHYEWIEQALFTSDAATDPHDPGGDLLDGTPVWSPLAIPLAYAWPVTSIGPGREPTQPAAQPTLVLVRRDPTNVVRFARISPLAYHLMASLRLHRRSGREHIGALALGIDADPAHLEALAVPLLRRLHEQGVVPGTAP
jgi:hypothetical protein